MTLSTKVVTGLSGVLEKRFSRRSFVGRTAVVGAAVAVGGVDFVLRPTPAYASVCGPGAACSNGWTAMCCTINDGINQCPPGSFAGGWWKADSAGLCGGSARYYIDCQGECTGCGCNGSGFCAEGCWNCTRHCASGTCDERRVCWNVFRYGQCHQEIGCSGPVLCRMISCVPPWQFEPCTTAVATDNNTTDHSAPCLSPWSAVQAAYAALGGAGSALGATVGAEFAITGGSRQNTVNGAVIGGGAGAFAVLQPRLGAYDAGGGVLTYGVPLGPQTFTADGAGVKQELSIGLLITVPGGGTYALWNTIASTYRSLGEERSVLGYPTAPQQSERSGGFSETFQNGAIVGSPYGTFAVAGAVYQQWVASGGVNGGYGFPVADCTGTVGRFEGGTIGGTPQRTLNRS